MSGTSARETFRQAKRTRPSDSGPSARMAPPVLFRLPSIAVPTDAGAAIEMHASTMSAPAMPQPAAAPPVHSAPESAGQAATNSAPAQMAAVTMSEEKAAAQRLLNVFIVVLLLAALVVITWISMQSAPVTPGVADQDQDAAHNSSFEKLSDIRLPEVTNSDSSSGSVAAAPTEDKVPADKSSTGQVPTENQLTSQPKTPTSNDEIAKSAELPELTLGSDLSADLKPTTPPSQRSADEKKPGDNAKSSTQESLLSGFNTSDKQEVAAIKPAAQIQLRTPVPVAGSDGLNASLVDTQRLQSSNNSSNNTSGGGVLFTTPRIDTVSSPTNLGSPASAAVSAPTTVAPTTAASTVGNSSSTSASSNSGDSPSLWDGAQKSVEADRQARSQLAISKPMSAELTMPQNAVPSTGQQLSQSQPTRAGGTATQPAAPQPAAPGPAVTVGGGYTEPWNLADSIRSTSTPDFDAADVAQRYIDVAEQKRLAGATSSPATSNAAPTTPSKPINSYAIGAGTNQPGTNLYVKPAPGTSLPSPTNLSNQARGQAAGFAPPTNGAAINSYAGNAPAPYGITGAPAGPYVPNSYAPNSYVQGNLVSAPVTPSASLPGFTGTTPPVSTGGYAVPPRGPQPGLQPTVPAGYSQPGYSQPGYAQPGYAQPGYAQPGSSYGTPSGSGFPSTTYPTPSPMGQNTGMQNTGMQNTGMQTGMQNMGMQNGGNRMGMMPAGSMPNGAASYPVASPYPGGISPTGMMGPSGYATAPSGDFSPARPVTGTMGFGTSMPTGAQ